MKVRIIIHSDILGDRKNCIEWDYPILPSVGQSIHNPLLVLGDDFVDELKSLRIENFEELKKIYPESLYEETIYNLIKNIKVNKNWTIENIYWDLDENNKPIPTICIKNANILNKTDLITIFKSHTIEEQQKINLVTMHKIAQEEYQKVIEFFDSKYGNVTTLWDTEKQVSILADSILNTEYIKISYWHGTEGSGYCFSELNTTSQSKDLEWYNIGDFNPDISEFEHLSKINYPIEIKRTKYIKK